MKVCFVGLANLPVLAPEYRQHYIGGEEVQQTLLGRALARRGHDVSMVVGDYGQPDGEKWDGIATYKAYPFSAGLPVIRFVHPRWTGMWSALRRADADIYYTSCAGMHVGLLATFCRRYGKRLVFRAASDADCDPAKLMIRYARDRWLYAYGLARADAVLVQSAWQQEAMRNNYLQPSRMAGMLVDQPGELGHRLIDLLWVSNIRQVKRPDRLIDLAALLPAVKLHIVGGTVAGEEELYERIKEKAHALRNLTFHGRLPYQDTCALYEKACVLVNTSDVEGFPNSYLQAWIRGVPVVTYLDSDGVIRREELGVVVDTPESMRDAVKSLLEDPGHLKEMSARCRAFMAREYGEERILSVYLNTFAEVARSGRS